MTVFSKVVRLANKVPPGYETGLYLFTDSPTETSAVLVYVTNEQTLKVATHSEPVQNPVNEKRFQVLEISERTSCRISFWREDLSAFVRREGIIREIAEHHGPHRADHDFVVDVVINDGSQPRLGSVVHSVENDPRSDKGEVLGFFGIVVDITPIEGDERKYELACCSWERILEADRTDVQDEPMDNWVPDELFEALEPVHSIYPWNAKSDFTANTQDAPQIFGREGDVCALASLLENVNVAYVTGRGGIGKTTLLKKFLATDDYGTLNCKNGADAPFWRNTDYFFVRIDVPRDELDILNFEKIIGQLADFHGISRDDSLSAVAISVLQTGKYIFLIDNFELLEDSGGTSLGDKGDGKEIRRLINAFSDIESKSRIIVCSRLPRDGKDKDKELKLEGLDWPACKKLLKAKGINVEVPGEGINIDPEENWRTIVDSYTYGIPQAIEIIAGAYEKTKTEAEEHGQAYDVLTLAQDMNRSEAFADEQRLEPIQNVVKWALALSAVSDTDKFVLFNLVASQRSMSVNELAGFVAYDTSDTRKSLKQLEAIGLVNKDTDENETYWMHGAVEDALLKILISKCRAERQRLRTQEFSLAKHIEYITRVSLYHSKAPTPKQNLQERRILRPVLSLEEENEEQIASKITAEIASLLSSDVEHPDGSFAIGNLISLRLACDKSLEDLSLGGGSQIRQLDARGVTIRESDWGQAKLSDTLFTQPMGSVRALDFKPDEDILLTGEKGNGHRLINVPSGTENQWFGHRETVRGVAFSPCGDYIIAAGDEKKDNEFVARVWKASDPSFGSIRLSKEIGVAHTRKIRAVATYPHLDQISFWAATAGEDSVVNVWKITPGSGTVEADHVHQFTHESHVGNDIEREANTIAFTPTLPVDDNHDEHIQLVCGGTNGYVTVWDIHGGSDQTCDRLFVRFCPAEDKTPGDNAGEEIGDSKQRRVWSIDIHPYDPRVIALSMHSGHVHLWRLPDESNGEAMFLAESKAFTETSRGQKDDIGHSESVFTVKFLEADNLSRSQDVAEQTTTIQLASGGEDNTICIWNVHSGETARNDEMHLDGFQRLKNPKGDPYGPGHTARVRALAWKKPYLASGGFDQDVILWKLERNRYTGTQEYVVNRRFVGYTNWVWSVHALNSEELTQAGLGDLNQKITFVAGYQDSEVRLWSALPDRPDAVKNIPYDDWVYDVKSRLPLIGGERKLQLLMGCKDGNVYRTNIAEIGTPPLRAHKMECRQPSEQHHTDWVWQLSLCKFNGTEYLFTVSEDYTVRMWEDLDGAHPVSQKLPDAQHKDRGRTVDSCVTEKGDLLVASGGYDCDVLLWRMPSKTEDQTDQDDHAASKMEFVSHLGSEIKEWIIDVKFSPDGQYLAAAGDDDYIWVWSMQNLDDLAESDTPSQDCCVCKLPNRHGKRIHSLLFYESDSFKSDSDGAASPYLLSAGDDGNVYATKVRGYVESTSDKDTLHKDDPLSSYSNTKEKWRSMVHTGAGILSIALIEGESEYLLTGDKDSRVIAWNIRDRPEESGDDRWLNLEKVFSRKPPLPYQNLDLTGAMLDGSELSGAQLSALKKLGIKYDDNQDQVDTD